MADNTSTFVLRVKTEGMPEAKKDSQIIRDNLEGAQKAASGTATSRKVASSAAAMPTGAAGASAGITGGDVETYNRARGAAGAAGGSARDFADQARGLGGLVRLYATFAANIFAATAAFGALSRAMDTTNMIKGLDMLGAASGRNLGQLSKRLVEASDGAISLRDAMEATAKTSAAGMSGQNIERLAKVAKNASLALGVSMPDALSRLSRGVSKLEPELLDELGLFTKIEPAVQAYAREVGKSASQLTDFERRQAFANAVIKEGEDKFAALAEASANPYDKLLASLKNVSQSGLELVNKVLAPIANLLAGSPTGLALALGGIAAILLKQAIPAIGQFRAGLAKAAEDSLQIAQGKAGDALAARTQLNRLIEAKVEASADTQVKAVEDAEKRMLSIQKDSINQRGAVYKLLKKDIVDIEQADLDAAERRYNRIKNDPSRKEEAAASRQVIDSVKGQIAAEKDLRDVKEKNRQQIQQDAKSWSVFGIVQQKAQDYELKAKKQAIVSNAAYNASLIGVGGAIRLMNVELEASGLKLGKVATAALYARAGLAVLASAAATVISGLNKFLGIIGIVTAAFGMLASFASKNGKEMNAFDSAVESANGSVENINRTLDLLKAKGGFAAATIEGIMAMSNAFGEAADSAQNLLNTSIRAKEAANGFDKLTDKLFSFFGGGIDKNLAKSLSAQLVSALEILSRSDLGDKYQNTFKQLLNVGSLDFNTVTDALNKADQATKEKFVKSLQSARTELAISASKLEAFKTATDGVVKSYQEFIQSTASNDPLFKLGASLETLSSQMQKVLMGGTAEIQAAFIELAKSPEKVTLFGPEFVNQFVKVKDGFLDQVAVITQYKQLLVTTQKDLAGFSKELAELTNSRDEATLKKKAALLEKIGKTANLEKDLKITIDTLPRDKIEVATGLFAQGISSIFEKSAELMKAALGNAAEKARLTIEKARIGVLSGELRATEENKLALRQIDIQIESVKINISLIESQERLNATLAEANSIATENKVREKPGATLQEIESAKSGRQADVIYKSIVESGMTIDKAIQQFEKTTHEGIKPLTRALIESKVAPLNRQLAQQRATLTTLGGERTAQQITGAREIRAGRAEDLEKIRTLNDSINQQESTRLGILQSITGVQSEYLTKQQALVDNLLLESRFAGELKVLRDKATEAEAAGYKEEARKIDEQIALVLKRQNLERDNKGLQDRLKLLQLELDNLAKQQEISKLYRDQYYTSLVGILELQGAQNQYNQENLSYSQEYIRQQNYLLDLQRLQTQESRAKADAEAQYQSQLAIANAKKKVAGADVGAINAEIARELIKRDITIAAAEQETILRTRILELQKKSGDEQDRINKLMDTTKSISESLSTVFGEFGQKLGGLTETLVGVGLQLEKNAKTEEDLRKKQTDFEIAGNYDKVFEIQDQIDKQKTKSVKDEISGNAKILGSAKTLFKEKTAAYKILGGIEKALHIARIAMDMKELFTKIFVEKGKTSAAISGEITQTGVAEAGFFARAGTYVTEIFGKISAQLGVFGPPVAAAIVAAIGLSAFGKKAVQPKGFTAEEQQKVQGTGQVYRDGKLVETGAGVLGDATAKSKSVENAIQNMEKYDFKNLEYSNQMLEALRGIRKNTENFAGNILKAIPGINIKPETIKSGSWFSSDTTEVLDQGIKIIGTVGQIIDQTAQILKYQNTKTTSGGLMGFIDSIFGAGGPSYGGGATPLTEAGPLKRDLSLIFKDVGKALGVAAEELGMGATTEIMNAFRSIDLSEQFKQISLMDLKPDEMVQALMSVVSSGMDMAAMQLMPSMDKFRKAGESFADTVLRVANDTRVVKLSFEELGMSLPKLVEQGAKPTTEQLNRLAAAQSAYNAALAATKETRTVEVSQGMDQVFQTTVTGSPEASAALANALIELTSAQAAVTTATNSLTTRNLDLVQSYIDAAGGLDQFVERNRFFAENFLTEAERLKPVQDRVNAEIARLAPQLAKLGITAESNRDQFKQAVLAAQALGESGVQLYTDLMKLAPAFDMVTKGAGSAALSVEDFSKKVLGGEVDIIKMQANLLEKSGDFQKAYTKLQESVLLSRRAELVELEKLPAAQRDVLKYQLEYKWSLEDLASQTENNIKINNQLISSQQNLVNYLDEALGVLNQALRLRGEGIDAQGIERTIKLQDLSAKYSGKENEVRLRVLTGLQKYVWALEDEKTAKDNYVKALQEQAAAIQREIAVIDKLMDQRTTIMQLTALTSANKDAAQSAAKLVARERELRQLRNDFARDEGLNAIIANQDYIYALEDEKEIKDRLVEAHNKEKDAIEGTISTIKDAIKSIKDYRNSLKFSSELSIMTPEQQYQEAKKIFEETLNASRTVGIDEAGVKAQQDALSKIPDVSNRFLELSRTLFASSGNYMTDYQVVQNALSMTEAALGDQLTEAQEQLEKLKIISDSLNLIEENTKTAADIFIEYQAAQRRSSSLAEVARAADSREFKDLDAARNTKLDQLKTANDKLYALGEKQLTTAEATVKVAETSAAYELAISNTAKALNDISGDVNNGTIRQAIEARAAAVDTISELKLANDYLNTILINTYATYQSQRQHFQNLINNPQDVNVTGGAVTTILAAIAANTAKTADNVTNVQTAVSAGTNAVVRNNTATSEQTAAVVSEAVTSSARGSNWKTVTLPEVKSSGTVIRLER